MSENKQGTSRDLFPAKGNVRIKLQLMDAMVRPIMLDYFDQIPFDYKLYS